MDTVHIKNEWWKQETHEIHKPTFRLKSKHATGISFPTAHFYLSNFLLPSTWEACALYPRWTCATCKKNIFSFNCLTWEPGGYWLQGENSVRLFPPWVRTDELNKDKQMCDGVNVWKQKSEVGKRRWFPDKIIISSPEGSKWKHNLYTRSQPYLRI